MSFSRPVRLETTRDLSLLREFARTKILDGEAKSFEDAHFDSSIYEELHRQGLMQMAVPSADGGPGGDVIDLACITREIGYASVSAALTYLANILGQSPVILFGSPELRRTVLPAYVNNFYLWSFGMTEAVVGSDLTRTTTTARACNGGWLINGEKNYITNAGHAEKIVVFARLLEGNRDLGVTAFFVDAKKGGVERGAQLDKIGWRSGDTGTLIFRDTLSTDMLGQPGEGLKILGSCLNRSKILMAATSVGMAERALEITQQHLLETHRFGSELITQPAIRHLLARMHTQVEAAWLLTCKAAETWAPGVNSTKESSMAKMFAGSAAVDITNECVELFGARGLFNGNEIARLYRDAKYLEIVEGPTLIQETLIAREVVPRPEKSAKVIPLKRAA